jgi:hypothetical protein
LWSRRCPSLNWTAMNLFHLLLFSHNNVLFGGSSRGFVCLCSFLSLMC